MARSTTRNRESDDTIAHSVKQTRGIVPNRTRQERRVGSGSTRRSQAANMRRAGAQSSSKTGPDRQKNRPTSRTRANKRPSKR